MEWEKPSGGEDGVGGVCYSNTMHQPPSSTRWCPTQDQVMILEEIYNRGGVKTPNALQIQQITAHLSYYGKVEGKNVFYWFQNHKARERQKIRRKLMQSQQKLQQHQYHLLSLQQHQLMHHHIINPLRQVHNWQHSLPSTTAHLNLHQGGRADAAGLGSTATTWCDLNGIDAWVQRMRRHDDHCSMMNKLSPGCSLMISRQQQPLKTLELFPLRSGNDIIHSGSSTLY